MQKFSQKKSIKRVVHKGTRPSGWNACHEFIMHTRTIAKELIEYLPNRPLRITADKAVDDGYKIAKKCCDHGTKGCAKKIWKEIEHQLYMQGYYAEGDHDERDIQTHLEYLKRRSRKRRYGSGRYGIPDHDIPDHNIPHHNITPPFSPFR